MNAETEAREVVNCPHQECRQRFSIPAPRIERPINYPHTSVIVVAHERPIKCPNCKHYMILGITGAKLSFQAGPISDEAAAQLLENEESRIILARGAITGQRNGKR